MLSLSDIITPTAATADRIERLERLITNLPQLHGVSKRQIGWAHGIRKRRVYEVLSLIEHSINSLIALGWNWHESTDSVIDRYDPSIVAVLSHSYAPDWIEHRDVPINVLLYMAQSKEPW